MENKKLAICCKRLLDLTNAKLSEEYYYKSLPLCVIDAVFSIGIKYTTARNVVIKFCNRVGIERLRKYGNKYPLIKNQFSIESLLNLYEEYSIDEITDSFFCNRNRTSPRNGILKSEAVFSFSKVLKNYGVNYFQDLPKLIGNKELENSIKEIPGQKSGISTSYFYMLAGEENFIKPDRMIIRFIEFCIEKKVDVNAASSLIMDAHKILKEEFLTLTPRKLDHEIWKYSKDHLNNAFNLTTISLNSVAAGKLNH